MAKTKPVKHPSLFIRNNPNAPQLCPDLAKEIGLNESILLLQWEYWMRSEAEERDGFLWLRRSVRAVQDFFPFWGIGTVHRTLQSLVKQGLLIAGDYDESPGRAACWYRLQIEGLSKLKSIRIDCSNLEQRMFQDKAKVFQSGATVLNNDFKDLEISTATAEPHPPGYKQPKKTKVPLPPNFTITDGMRNWARGIGLSDDRIDNAHDRYVRDVEKKCKKFYAEHWLLDWEEWMLREVNFARNGNGHKQDDDDEPRGNPSWMAPEKPVGYFDELYADFKTQ